MFVISRTALLLISHIALLVRVPAAVAKSGRLIVHPHIDKPAAPRQLGPSDDFRQLGVFLTSLDLAAVEPGAETPNTSH
jgi:hypothetical protein